MALVICVVIAVVFIHYRNYTTIGLILKEESTEISFLNVSRDNSSVICTTKGCNMSTSSLLKNINFNVDPCNNFYQFTCGNFIKNTEIPKDKSSTETRALLTDRVDKQLLESVSEPIQPSDIRPIVLTKQLFKACMNEKILEGRGKDPLTKILKKLGGWPVLEKNTWNETKFNWSETIIEIKKLGLDSNILFSVYIDYDLKNKTKFTLTVDEAWLGIRREYFIQGLENKMIYAYFEYMNKLATALGAEKISAQKELKEIILLEMKIANYTSSITERIKISSLYNIKSIKQLQEAYPTIPWLHYLNTMLYSMVNLTENKTLLLKVPEYIKEIEKLIQQTPKRVLANYIIWRAVKQIIPYLSKDYYKFQDEFEKTVSGITSQPSREKLCFGRIRSKMLIAVSALFLRKYFNKEAKNDAVKLVKNIQNEFKTLLENIDWMDNKTRKNALEKIDAVDAHVAYPDELMDDNKLIEYYKNFTLDEKLYLETALNLSLFESKKYIQEILQPFKENEWIRHSYAAYVIEIYIPEQNSLELPAAILQDEFFSNDRPKYMNYGSIGTIVGSEFIHTVDDFGRKYDKDGNLVNWWEDSTYEAYKKKAKCIDDQYENTTYLPIYDEFFYNKIIGDNGGIKIAYRAYERWAKQNDPEPSLPGLSFTPRQMFWISSVTTRCSKYRQEFLRNVDAPIDFEVNNVMRNQEDFAKDFGCPKGSPMNPEKKCTLW